MLSNEVIETIKKRRSVRSYMPQQIGDGELQSVLEAGLYAPNAGGQAWHFTAIQDRELLARLNVAAKQTALNSGISHLVALGNDDNFDCLYGAPTLVIVSSDSQVPIPLEADCAAAIENMLIVAESLDIGSCWIYFVMMAFLGVDGPQYLQTLRIPDGYKPQYAAIFGYKRDGVVKAPDRKSNLITYIR